MYDIFGAYRGHDNAGQQDMQLERQGGKCCCPRRRKRGIVVPIQPTSTYNSKLCPRVYNNNLFKLPVMRSIPSSAFVWLKGPRVLINGYSGANGRGLESE